VLFTLENDTFPETIIIPEITGASKTNTISFTSVEDDTAAIISSYDYTIKLDGADYCRFEQLKIMSENNSDARTLLIEGGAHNNIFKKSIFEHKEGGEYLVYSGTDIDSNNVFLSNLFKNSNYYGIFLYGNDITSETGNQIIANTFMDIKYKHVKVFWQDSVVIKNNRLINTADYPDGIVLKDCNKGMVANNMLNFQSVERANALKIITSDSVKVYYNTVRISPNIASSALTLEGRDLEVKNNILVNENNGYAITCRDSTGLDCDYNALYSALDATFCEWLGSNVVSFEAWKDSSRSDIHSMEYLPEFLAPDDLHSSDLALNYTGTPLPEVTVDYDGETRDLAHPDIGADEMNLGVPLAGEYHIGSGQTFTSFSEVIDSMLQVGIADSVTFLVDSETYTEQVHIPHIPLSGPEKPVSFESASGNPEDVILEYTAPDSANYVVWLDSVQNVSLKNLTIRALDDSIATVIHLGNNAKNNRIEGNIIYGNGRYASAVLAKEGNNSNNRFVSNIIYEGLNGISLVGDEDTETRNNVIQGNTFKNQYQMPVYCTYQKWQRVLGNEIIHSNPIETKWAGIALVNCSGGWDSLSLTANNMISYNANQLSAGILLSGSSYQNVYHNNVNVFGDSEDSRAFNQEEGGGNINVYNNIFSNKANGLIIYSTNPGNINYNYNLLFNIGEKFIYTNQHIEDLEAWQNEGKGSYSIDIDPLFVSDTDLHIQETGLFSKGKQVSQVVTDFDGDVRDQANPTIGADVIKTDCAGPLSGEYTIGSSGDYMTISDAVTALISCGMDNTVIFEIAPGTYNEQLYLPNSFTGKTASDSVVFKSLSGNPADVTITDNAKKSKNYILKIDGLDNFVLKDITITAIDTTYGRLLNISGNTKNCTFDGNIFKGIETKEDNDTLALICYSENSTDSTQVFKNNTFKYGSRAVIKNNSNLSDLYKFQNNQFIQQGSGCIMLNHIHTLHFNKNKVMASTNSFDCIEHTNYSDSLIIRKNKVNIQVADKGSYINTYSPAYMSNNYVSFNTTNTGKSIYLLNADNAYLFFNTMVIYGNGYETYFYRAPDKLVQKNNILANLSDGEIYTQLLHTDINSNYNNLFTKSETFGHWNNIDTQDSFEEYVDLTGQDTNSVSFNPHFLSDTSGHTNQALLNNKGIPIPEITTDIEGNIRDAATPDIGAYEFSNPELRLGEDIRKCANESHTLHAGVGFDSYNWSTGSDSVSTVIDTTETGMGPQEISVHVTLDDNSYYDTVMVNLESPHDFLTEKDYCVYPYDDSIKISAVEGYSYRWENGDTTNTTYTLDSYFHVTAIDEIGCEKEEFVTLHYNNYYADMAMPSDTVISGSDNILLEASDNSNRENYNRFNYFWNTGDTTFTINLSAEELGTGEHEIEIQMINLENQCSSSDSLLIIVEDINNNKTSLISDKIKVYPNPSNGKLCINSQNVSISAVELITLEGKKIDHFKEVNEIIDLHTKKPGMYILKIHADNEIIFKRVILK